MLYFSKWKLWSIAALCLAGLILGLPSFISPATRSALEEMGLSLRWIHLGLDLQGGSSLLLRADTAAVVSEHLDTMVDQVRSQLRTAEFDYTGLKASGRSVEFHVLGPQKRPEIVELLDTFLTTGLPFGSVPDYQIVTSGDDLVRLELNPAALTARIDSSIQQAIEVIRRRIDESGINEPSIARQGQQRILIQLPGIDDPDRIKRLLGRTAKMTFRLLHPESDSYAGGALPSGAVLLKSTQDDRPGFPDSYLVRRRVDVDGNHLIDAQVGRDSQTGEWVVNFTFDVAGAQRFARVTKNNVNRPFAIVLDNQVISAPVIREPILGGRGQISGGFTAQEANDLAVLLRAGALPVPLTIIEERTVGPDLGADAIRSGLYACVIGFILVIAYMMLTYGFFGVIASLALIANLWLIAGVLSLLQVTLTLPGIAGLLLTLGMAVDANILISERIREESRLLRSPHQAIESGFRRAFATIIDSNITTLITMLLLYSLGSGPVRGFAVTISCGIITSLFSAMVLTRLMIVSWLRYSKQSVESAMHKGQHITDLPEQAMAGFAQVVQSCRIVVARSSRIIVARSSRVMKRTGIGAEPLQPQDALEQQAREPSFGDTMIEVHSLDLIEVHSSDAIELAPLRAALESLNLGESSLQTLGSPEQALIRLQRRKGIDNAQAISILRAALSDGFPNLTIQKVEVVEGQPKADTNL